MCSTPEVTKKSNVLITDQVTNQGKANSPNLNGNNVPIIFSVAPAPDKVASAFTPVTGGNCKPEVGESKI